MKKFIDQHECLKRFRLSHGNKYDYSKVEYINSSIKVKIICKEHGEFLQSPKSHWDGQGCPNCRHNKPINQNECLKRFKLSHGNKYDYSKVEYHGKSTAVKIICREHGEFLQRPDVHWNGGKCRYCANRNISRNKRIPYNIVLEKFKSVHGNKYDYSLYTEIEYNKNSDLIPIICNKHGIFKISSNMHRKGGGCPICAKSSICKPKFTQEKCLEKFKLAHSNKYDYSKVKYIGSCEYVTIICKEHGEFIQQPYNHWNGHGCPSCAVAPFISKNEYEIFDFINSYNLNPIQSNRTIIKPYELDIVIPTKN